jgi:hypothetical protein
MISDNIISRRTFCGIATFGITGLLAGAACKTRAKVLKYPENAEEIADFFEFFTDPAFNVDAAIKGLNLTGDPRVFDADKTWRRSTYPKQNDLIRDIELDTDPVELTSIYIRYDRLVQVSLGRLEGLFGGSKNFGGQVGRLYSDRFLSTIQASNIDPSGPVRHGPPPITSYGFFPKPRNKNVYDGDILISANITEDNIKKVDMIRFQRHKQTE